MGASFVLSDNISRCLMMYISPAPTITAQNAKKRRVLRRGAQLVKKASQSSHPQVRKG